jgi:hypothetical protein
MGRLSAPRRLVQTKHDARDYDVIDYNIDAKIPAWRT